MSSRAEVRRAAPEVLTATSDPQYGHTSHLQGADWLRDPDGIPFGFAHLRISADGLGVLRGR